MKRRLLLHPLLFAVYPSLFTFRSNIETLSWSVLIKPVLASLILALLLWGMIRLAVASPVKSALLASLLISALFSYGHVLEAITNGLLRQTPDMQALALFICAVPLPPLAAWAARTPRPLTRLTAAANVMGLVLCLIPALSAAHYTWRRAPYDAPGAGLPSPQTSTAASAATRPDLYYIVLDAYGRSDVLHELYGYDNGEFIEFLRSRNFFVAADSRSNYMLTLLSLASALNLDYLQNLPGPLPVQAGRGPLREALRHHRLASLMRAQGYRVVTSSASLPATQVMDADERLERLWFFNEYDAAVFALTPAATLLTRFGLPDLHTLYRRQLLFAFDHLAEFSRSDKPSFVFAHFLSPHPPFVFTEDGQAHSPDRPFSTYDGNPIVGSDGSRRPEYVHDYRSQAIFISKRVQRLVDDILENSSTLPIIVLQGDHGPRSYLKFGERADRHPCLRECFGILNAIYLPDGNYERFYQSITPVNTIRLIVNKYYGGSYPLLPDRSFFSDDKNPLRLTGVSDDLPCEAMDTAPKARASGTQGRRDDGSRP